MIFKSADLRAESTLRVRLSSINGRDTKILSFFDFTLFVLLSCCLRAWRATPSSHRGGYPFARKSYFILSVLRLALRGSDDTFRAHKNCDLATAFVLFCPESKGRMIGAATGLTNSSEVN